MQNEGILNLWTGLWNGHMSQTSTQVLSWYAGGLGFSWAGSDLSDIKIPSARTNKTVVTKQQIGLVTRTHYLCFFHGNWNFLSFVPSAEQRSWDREGKRKASYEDHAFVFFGPHDHQTNTSIHERHEGKWFVPPAVALNWSQSSFNQAWKFWRWPDYSLTRSTKFELTIAR